MSRSLNTEYRPQSLDDFIGSQDVVFALKESLKQGRIANTYLFSGAPGTGKTSMARVLAKLINKNEEQLDITEIDTADLSADNMRELVARCRINPWVGEYKCIIINEAQKLSAPAQEILLDTLEEPTASTVLFLCSSEPQKLSQAIIRRCTHYKMTGLNEHQTSDLVAKVIKAEGVTARFSRSEPGGLSLAGQLVKALVERDVTSPGLIMKAIELLITGVIPEEAAMVQETTNVDTFAIAKAAARGDWDTARDLLAKAPKSAARDIRSQTAGYFKSILIKENLGSARAQRCVWAISQLADLANQNQFEEGMIWAATIAAIYNICAGQKEYISKKA